MGTFKKNDLWEQMSLNSWITYCPPWRISYTEFIHYLSLIKKINPQKTLIFGATPEIRDILSSLKKQVTVVDSSPNMIFQMGKLMANSKKREQYVINDWLHIDSHEKYDLIIGDLIFRLIDFNQFPLIVGKIRTLLVNNGYFVTRMHVIHREKNTIKSCIEKHFRFFKDNLLKEQSIDLLVASLFDLYTNESKNNINIKQMIKDLDKECQIYKGEKKDFIKHTLLKWGNKNINYTQLTKKVFLKSFYPYFKLQNTLVCNDYYESKKYPIYSFKFTGKAL